MMEGSGQIAYIPWGFDSCTSFHGCKQELEDCLDGFGWIEEIVKG
jgi:hypothetical protein